MGVACCDLEAARLSAAPSSCAQASSPGGGGVQPQVGESWSWGWRRWGGSRKLRGDQGWFRDPGSETVDSAAGLSSQGGWAEKTILGP